MGVISWARVVFASVGALALLTCGGGGDDGGKDSSGEEDGGTVVREEVVIVTAQDVYADEAAFKAQAATGDLDALWEVLKSQGFTQYGGAGLTRQDDGLEVIWLETSKPSNDGSGEARGVARRCGTGDCVTAAWSRSGNSLTWTDEEGADVVMEGVGLPILLKQLDGHTYDKPTHTVQLALEPPKELPEIDISKRRMLVASSFGPLWGPASFDAKRLAEAAEKASAFDEVQLSYYVRSETLDNVFTHWHPYDALIWLGQTVREEAKTNEIWKPVGLTVNRGIFGDVLYDRAKVEELLAPNPMKGPGLVVLAACESMGDGNGGGEIDKNLPKALDNKARILVGFKKCGDARHILEASSRFLETFFGGASLGDSIAKANDYLDSADTPLEMVTLPDANPDSTFLVDLDKYWDRYTDAGTPDTATFLTNINIVNMCTPPQGAAYQEDESFASAWTSEIVWNGPFFSGTRTNPQNLVDVEIAGALYEIREGAHFFFSVKGGLDPNVQDIVVYGDAVIDQVFVDDEKPDEFVIVFKGQGIASEYVNEAGDTCIMQAPLLVSTTGEPGKLTVPVPFKGEGAQEGGEQ